MRLGGATMSRLFISHGPLEADLTAARALKARIVAAGAPEDAIDLEADGVAAFRSAAVVALLATQSALADPERLTRLRLASGYGPVLVALGDGGTAVSPGDPRLVDIEHEPPRTADSELLAKRAAEALEGADDRAPRLFLSYARADAARVDRLVGDLRERGLRVFVDRAVLDPGADWLARLFEYIDAADAVIFAVSPAALASRVCALEVDRAMETATQILPVVLVRPSDAEIAAAPAALRTANFVFADEEARWPRALAEITAWTQRDADWRRAHARLASQAFAWSSAEAAARADVLLRGGVLAAAFSTVQNRPKQAPATPRTVLDFLEASRAHEQEQRDALRRAVQHAFVEPVRRLASPAPDDAAAARSGVDPAGALRRLAAAALLSDDPELTTGDGVAEPHKAALWRAGAAAVRDRALAILHGHARAVKIAAWSPDGARILTIDGADTARLWDGASAAEIAVFQAPERGDDFRGEITSAHWSPDGSRILTCWRLHPRSSRRSYDEARVWDAETGADLFVHHEDRISGVNSATWSPDGARILLAVSWVSGHAAQAWDVAAGVEASEPLDHDDAVASAAWSPDGARVVTACEDGTARIWNVASSGFWSAGAVLRGHEDGAPDAAWSPDGTRLLTASRGLVRVWDANDGAELAALGSQKAGAESAAWSPDGTRILAVSNRERDGRTGESAAADFTVRVWEPRSGAEIVVLRGHADDIRSAEWSPDGARILTGSEDRTARIWDAATGSEITGLRGHTGPVEARWSPDGFRVLTASRGDATARLWDAASGATRVVLDKRQGKLTDASWSPDGTRVLTSSFEGAPRVWDAATGAEIAVLREHSSCLHPASWSPDGALVLTYGEYRRDARIRVWDASTGSEVSVLATRYGGEVWSAAWSPDGARIAAAHDVDDAMARVWDVASATVIAELRGHGSGVRTVGWSPDGARLVTIADDDAARIWDATSWAEIAVLSGSGARARSAAWSPDGTRIATISTDAVRVWDPVSGAEISAFPGASSVRWSPDGARLYTASPQREPTRVWDVESGAEIAQLPGPEYATPSAWSPDGALVAAPAGGDVLVREAASGAVIDVLRGRAKSGDSLEWSPDGRRILTSGESAMARVESAVIWDASLGRAAVDGDAHSATGGATANVKDRAILLCAALSHGIGRRLDADAEDLLLQSAPEDLFAAYKKALVAHRCRDLPSQTAKDARRAAIEAEIADAAHRLKGLSSPDDVEPERGTRVPRRDPRCYLAPSQRDPAEAERAREIYENALARHAAAPQSEVAAERSDETDPPAPTADEAGALLEDAAAPGANAASHEAASAPTEFATETPPSPAPHAMSLLAAAALLLAGLALGFGIAFTLVS